MEDEFINPEIPKCEAFKAVRGSTMVLYQSGKLKDSHIKKFLTDYYDGNPNDMLKGSNKAELLEQYILTVESLVGDDLKQHPLNELYERNGRKHCCGKQLKMLRKGYPYCEICGTEY